MVPALAIIGSMALVSVPLDDVNAEFEGYDWRIDQFRTWERLDVSLTNTSGAAQSLSVCPSDAELLVQSHRVEATNAFAIKFDNEGWSHSCKARELAPGQSVKLGVYFRSDARWQNHREVNADRFLSIDTSLGNIAFQNGFGLYNNRAGTEEPVPVTLP